MRIKRIRKISVYSVILLLGVIAFLTSCTTRTENGDGSGRSLKKYPVWQPGGNFPIGFWGGPPPEFNNIDNWKIITDAGFTYGECSYESPLSQREEIKALKICEKLNFPLLLRFPVTFLRASDYEQNRDKLKAVIEEYDKYSSCFGFFVGDEPVYQEFAWYKRFYQIFRELAPDKFIDSNLLGMAPFEHGGFGAVNYTDYLEKYVQIVKPTLLSYDYYLMCEKKDRPDFFQNLEIARRVGLKHGIPIGIFLQTAPHRCPMLPQVKSFGEFRVLEPEEVRWQVYSSLAYGVKAIKYFTYWTFLSSNYYSKEHPERVAIVDPDGRPTKLYDPIKTINFEIRSLSKKLLDLTSVDVFHSGMDIPAGCKKLGTDSLLWTEKNIPLILGFFKDSNNEDYAMIVNRDYRNSQDFEMSIAKNIKEVNVISARDGKELPVPLKNGKFHLALTPGNGCLLHLSSGYEYPGLFIPHPVDEKGIKGIGASDNGKTIYARKDFTLEKVPLDGRIFLTAVHEYVLSVNGQEAGSGKNWYNGKGYDIKKYLKSGKNTIAIKALNTDGWGEGGARIFAQIELVEENGLSEKIVSDKTWKVSSSEEKKWDKNSFDDSNWKQANDNVCLRDFPYGTFFRGFTYGQ